MSKCLFLTAICTVVLAGQLSLANPDRLLADEVDPPAGESRSAPEIRGGVSSVRGRMLHHGRPLVGCRVVLLSLRRFGGAYHSDEERKPLDATTDSDGIYLFENVPAGSYKLKWLPQGTKQWVRRIGARPDVVVHDEEEVVRVKDIAALRTIN